MKYVLFSKDPEVLGAVKGAFQPDDEVVLPSSWSEALAACDGAEILFVDMIATLEKPGQIAGYEKFAAGKMGHPVAAKTPLVVINPPEDYQLDSMVGYPDFVTAVLTRPVDWKKLRRMTTIV